MNKLSGLLAFLLITVSLALPQQPDYDYDYGSPSDGLEEEEEVHDELEGDMELPLFVESSRTIAVREGDPVQLSCQPEKPTQHILIFKRIMKNRKKETLIYVGIMKLDHGTKFANEDNIFKLEHVRKSDAGTYVCGYQANPTNELTYVLDVQYPSTVVAKSPPEQRVNKGESATVECQAKGNPDPIITWSKETGHLPSGLKQEEGYSMTLENVDRHVEGVYTCTANNGVGEAVSASMKIVVEYPPEITTEKAIIRTGEGDVVELVCIIHARPGADVTWSKDDAPLTLNSEITETDGGHRHTITITHVTEENFGAYECTAVNDMGASSATINITDLPKQPHFTSPSTSAEETSYTLAWETESYYPIMEYTVKYRPAKANDSTDLPGEWIELNVEVSEDNMSTEGLIHRMKHTLDDLIPATDYQSTVSVKNKIKWGDVGHFNFSTRKASPTTTSTTTIATITSTPIPLAEEKVQYPSEETVSWRKTSGSDVLGVSLTVSLVAVILSLIS